MKKKRVIVGLSGGVDSAISAWLLKQQGYEVEALFMKNWEEDDTEDYCAASQDLKDAAAVCTNLRIPLHTINFSAEYWDCVFRHFLEVYKAGYTPNPDILCNKEIKFKCFLSYALNYLGANKIATGHYATNRLSEEGYYVLGAASDPNKDQTYFLYTLSQSQLPKILFPLAHLTKTAVRQLASEIRLPNWNKKDSVGICFIGKRPFKRFLERYLSAEPGPIKTPEGQVLGQHDGLMYYTLGQRQGLKIGGQQQGTGKAWYVASKNVEKNTLIAVQGRNHPLLYSKTLTCVGLSWVSGSPPPLPFVGEAKVRYRQLAAQCLILQKKGRYCVEFFEPQWAITPGQAVVFYQGTICLGGGTIDANL